MATVVVSFMVRRIKYLWVYFSHSKLAHTVIPSCKCRNWISKTMWHVQGCRPGEWWNHVQVHMLSPISCLLVPQVGRLEMDSHHWVNKQIHEQRGWASIREGFLKEVNLVRFSNSQQISSDSPPLLQVTQSPYSPDFFLPCLKGRHVSVKTFCPPGLRKPCPVRSDEHLVFVGV